MIEKPLKYNTNAQYASGGVYKIRNLQIVTQDIHVASDMKTFKASFLNTLEKIYITMRPVQRFSSKMVPKMDVILAKQIKFCKNGVQHLVAA